MESIHYLLNSFSNAIYRWYRDRLDLSLALEGSGRSLRNHLVVRLLSIVILVNFLYLIQ